MADAVRGGIDSAYQNASNAVSRAGTTPNYLPGTMPAMNTNTGLAEGGGPQVNPDYGQASLNAGAAISEAEAARKGPSTFGGLQGALRGAYGNRGAGPYTPGMNRLDAYLVGGDQGAMAKVNGGTYDFPGLRSQLADFDKRTPEVAPVPVNNTPLNGGYMPEPVLPPLNPIPQPTQGKVPIPRGIPNVGRHGHY